MSFEDNDGETLIQGGVAIESLPKITLHDHLDGALRPETIIELARSGSGAGAGAGGSDSVVELPTTDPAALADWFFMSCNSGSLPEYLKTFDLTVSVMQTAAQLERVAREWVLDIAAEGVLYGECRWAPEQHLRAGLSLDESVEAVQRGLDAGVAEVAAAGGAVDGGSIRVGQVLCAMRHADRSLEIAELALRHRDNGVVGFDIAGAEHGFPAGRHAKAFRLLAENQFPATVHAGEADGLASIESALVDGYALRLGHGVRLAEDITIESSTDDAVTVSLGHLAQWVKDRSIALELCPSSNLQTGAVEQWGDTLAEHPFDLFYQLGFAVTANPDNRLMSGTTVSRELGLLVDEFAYTIHDLEQLQVTAAMAAFLSLEDRLELVDRIENGFTNSVRENR